jgi:lipoyl(octanoyl) transferase
MAQETGRDIAPADLVSRIIEELRKNEDALVATPEGALL